MCAPSAGRLSDVADQVREDGIFSRMVATFRQGNNVIQARAHRIGMEHRGIDLLSADAAEPSVSLVYLQRIESLNPGFLARPPLMLGRVATGPSATIHLRPVARGMHRLGVLRSIDGHGGIALPEEVVHAVGL